MVRVSIGEDFELVFEHQYDWENDGAYYSNTPEERAMSRAASAAWKAGVGRADRIVLDRLPCTQKHVNVCAHLRVTIWKKL